MTSEQFESVYANQVAIEQDILIDRAVAYATKGNRLGNFYEGAQLNDSHPMRYAFNLMSKHIIALRDLIIRVEAGEEASEEKITDYVTDIRNYSLLIKALHIDQQERNES